MPLATGQTLNNRYRIVRLLGQGGFGAVYRAWDTTFNLPCAIKENLETSKAAQRQFLREARLLRTLRHPNLPEVSDYFVSSGQGQYLVMDFVEGEDLWKILQHSGRPLPEAQVLAWIVQICDALSYMHAQEPPIIHRDIKPANIKITPQGKAMLVDFGIAKQFDPHSPTTMGARAVTPGYSPIEQYGSGGHTDARSDVYALGATLYVLLAGEAPEDAPDRNLGVGLVPPRTLNSQISPGVEAAILKAVAMLPADRYQSVVEFRQALAPPFPILTPNFERLSVGTWRDPSPAVGITGEDEIDTGVAQPLSNTHSPDTLSGASKSASARQLSWGWLGAIAALLTVVIGLAVLFSREATIERSPPSAVAVVIVATSTAPDMARTTLGTTPVVTEPSRPSDTPELLLSPTPASPPDRITDDTGAEMALIPAGEFQMGGSASIAMVLCQQFRSDCDSRWFTQQEPANTVYLDAFYMDIYEVTNAPYEKCVRDGACTAPAASGSETHSSYYGNSEFAGYPVVYVTWHQAQSFCAWRGARLPTEAEWEKAARGGLVGRLYSWSDETPDCQRANYWDKAAPCVGDTSRVGSYPVNGYGLFDMAGNVWEWVSSLYRPYPYDAGDGRESLSAPGERVMRGGSWDDTGHSLPAAYRYGLSSDFSSRGIGFRCVRSP